MKNQEHPLLASLSEAERQQMGESCVAISKLHFMDYFNNHHDPTQLAVYCAAEGFLQGMAFMKAKMEASVIPPAPPTDTTSLTA